uniref:Ubiquinone biosynthesis protein n=1 Tax=Kalanchoe fedtschenkoi TaxID=63787 RepID=A0A7N0UXR6_KALFE
MYRAVARRLMWSWQLRSVHCISTVRQFCGISESVGAPIPKETPSCAKVFSATNASSSSSSVLEERISPESAGGGRGRRLGIDYQEEQARVLEASLAYVNKFGWSEEAMIAGAREVGLSPSIIGSFQRKEAALVEFFMDLCLERLSDRVDTDGEIKNLILSERIAKLVRTRLEMQSPYISKWPQALSIQAQPSNVATSLKQRAELVDEIWHVVGEEASDVDWYVKRTILGGIYSATEIYMLTDNSAGFKDTWSFLHNRMRDAFDLKKTVLEARYLAEAVGAGMGKSVERFIKSVFPE